jgi:rhodanese-related sulfurtransferase
LLVDDDDMMNRKNRTGGIDNMRKVFVLVLVSLIVLLTMPLIFTNVALANATDAGYINITAEEAKQMIGENQNIVILDVRTLAEYKSGHIDGSKLIPLLELEERINAIDGNSAVIVYCRHGVKSEKASKIFIDHGFDKVYNIMGGLNAWQDAGFPVGSGSTANHIFPSNNSLSSEIDDILSSGKPVFLFLYVDWCHFCQQQIPIIDELEQEYNGKITFIRVNCEMHPDAMTDLEARGYPSMFLILRKGDDGNYEYQDFRGFTDKETLKESIDWITTNRGVGESISLSVLKPLMFTSEVSASCSWNRCMGGCIDAWLTTPAVAAMCGGSCAGCGLTGFNPLLCAICLTCISGFGADCAGTCTGDSCWYGHTCRPGTSNDKCDTNGDRLRASCQNDGLAWDWSNAARTSHAPGEICGNCISTHQGGELDDITTCGWVCDAPHAHTIVGPMGHVCECDTDYGNCDGDWSNGCEVNLNTDPNNCGSCGNACGANAYCSGGTCHCNEGYGNCDGDWSNGCEVNTNTDRNNCGSCGNACPADYPCCFDKDLADCTYSCASGNCLMSKTNIRPCPTGQHCEGGECKDDVPEFPAGVTAVFGATLFIFLMMRRKYVRK